MLYLSLSLIRNYSQKTTAHQSSTILETRQTQQLNSQSDLNGSALQWINRKKFECLNHFATHLSNICCHHHHAETSFSVTAAADADALPTQTNQTNPQKVGEPTHQTDGPAFPPLLFTSLKNTAVRATAPHPRCAIFERPLCRVSSFLQ